MGFFYENYYAPECGIYIYLMRGGMFRERKEEQKEKEEGKGEEWGQRKGKKGGRRNKRLKLTNAFYCCHSGIQKGRKF